MNTTLQITRKQAKLFENNYNHFNKNLFQGKLPECLISLSIKVTKYGCFRANVWQNKQKKNIHEITLNPQIFKLKPIEWNAIIVRNMCFLWCPSCGKNTWDASSLYVYCGSCIKEFHYEIYKELRQKCRNFIFKEVR